MKQLTSTKEWEGLLEQSKQKLVIIFKHSNACSTSAAAFDRVHQAVIDRLFSVPVHVVVVQTHRDISDQIATHTNVTHESPQAIIIKNKEVIYSASHGSIDPEIMKEYLR